jgi:hemolysin III
VAGDGTPAMQRLDHAMIFILIAGTYTPVLLLRMPEPYDVVGLCAVWGLALAGRRRRT